MTTTTMMCSRNVATGSKSYWPVSVSSEAEAFRQRSVAQKRCGNRFVVSFFRADAENAAPKATVAEATVAVETAREAAANTCTMTAFLAMTKKAQAAFAADGGRVLPDPAINAADAADVDYGF